MNELKLKKQGQWYSCLKKITSYEQQKNEQLIYDEISHLSDSEQAEIIADKFASVQNEYQQLNTEDISAPHFYDNEITRFSPSQVWFALT